MKRLLALILIATCIFAFSGCGNKNTFKISIIIPAGSDDGFYYSDEEISPTGKKITISECDGIEDTEILLKPVEVREENAYEPMSIAPDTPVTIDVEKGAWFKVGVYAQNNADSDMTVYLEIEGIDVRIE